MFSMELINECKARKDAVSEKKPLSDPFTLSQIKDFYRVPNVWSSNAIEGNTLTEEETAIILRDGITVGQHTLGEMFEAIGGGKAYDFMFTILESETVTQDDILHFHELVTFGQPELQPIRKFLHCLMNLQNGFLKMKANTILLSLPAKLMRGLYRYIHSGMAMEGYQGL